MRPLSRLPFWGEPHRHGVKCWSQATTGSRADCAHGFAVRSRRRDSFLYGFAPIPIAPGRKTRFIFFIAAGDGESSASPASLGGERAVQNFPVTFNHVVQISGERCNSRFGCCGGSQMMITGVTH